MGLAVVPTDWTEGFLEWCVQWPNSPEWNAILRGLLQSPIEVGFWDKFTGNPDTAIATIELTLDQNLHLEECMKIPIGGIIEWGGVLEPENFLFAHGQAISRTFYSELFEVYGTRFGSGNGTTTFNLPNKQGKVGIGWSATENEFNDVGNVGGEKTHVLTVAEMPVHTHIQNAHTHVQNSHNHNQDAHNHTQQNHGHQVGGVVTSASGTVRRSLATVFDNPVASGETAALNNPATAANQPTTPTNQDTTPTNQNTGSGNAHNNVQPYIVFEYIIRVK